LERYAKRGTITGPRAAAAGIIETPGNPRRYNACACTANRAFEKGDDHT
jgi:hypothetical protein